MRYAINQDGEKIEVIKSGDVAYCPGCKGKVYGRKGDFNTPHWYHKTKECDTWYEPMTQWHIDWQNKFPLENREVVIFNNDNTIWHRADIKTNKDKVIEIQNSSIDIARIYEREQFYNKNNLIWILNGASLASNSIVQSSFKPKGFEISLEIPTHIENVSNYNMDDFQIALRENSVFKELQNHTFIKEFEVKRGWYYFWSFREFVDTRTYTEMLEVEVQRLFRELYGFGAYYKCKEKFSYSHYLNSTSYYYDIHLVKKNWRKFIDIMDAKVYLDNLNGLPTDMLLDYRNNTFLPKNEFICRMLE
ncbi:MAG TPA: competence protein CoiA family protein [Chitinophagales bacterium]|nr:competence protein CoiA family protein [Chitinophagales bacterium]HRG27796.1 competence protein CoiA family protein [Chitinophagales bacterium]HRG84535.1 competence protein CoiA family protein [Chitinophagales bacterium]HRH52750.1 competence protein CoiA family protein [Chitinophagales bacterium]